jgi:hypothetical protein
VACTGAQVRDTEASPATAARPSTTPGAVVSTRAALALAVGEVLPLRSRAVTR